MKNLLVMANYNTWVNAQIFEVCRKISDEQYRKDLGTFFGSIHNTLNHILLVDLLYLGRLNGESNDHIHSLKQVLYDDLESLVNARVKVDRELTECVQGLSQDELYRPVRYTRMSGEVCEENVEDILLTLFNHQTHHRGQVHAMLTQSGIEKSEMPDIDLVDYLASAKA